MATYRLCFATSPKSAASLHEQITSEEDAGYLPVVPIKIHASGRRMSHVNGTDNVFAALGHRYRVCYIDLWGLTSSLLEGLAAVMQEPFPSLTCLWLSSSHKFF
jgi:hypothetical protein